MSLGLLALRLAAADEPDPRGTVQLVAAETLLQSAELFGAFAAVGGALALILLVAVLAGHGHPPQNLHILRNFARSLPIPRLPGASAQNVVGRFVETPFEIEVYEIGVDYVLGGTEDELGVERVRVWPLDRVHLPHR